MARVIVTDPLAQEGIKLLADAGHEVIQLSGPDDSQLPRFAADAEAWIVRSGTQIGAKQLALAPNLRAIGRAGVGVDNIALDAATEAGVAVFHAPTGNITSAAEQAWALLLAVARRIPAADAGMKQEKWLRKQLKGVELHGKTMFIVGLGRIGRMMAERAQAFGIKTIGYDPYVTPEVAATFGVELVALPDGFSRAQFITLHSPLTAQTQNLVDKELVSHARDAILVNAARGGLVDLEAVAWGLENGHLLGAGIDVWPVEPPSNWDLAKHERVVAAPHLGASTTEAQVKAATQACERVANFLATGDAALAVNAQATVSKELQPWADLARQIASFAVQTIDGPIQGLTVTGSGVDAQQLLVAATVGALQATGSPDCNAISAPGLAKENGWSSATRQLEDGDHWIRVTINTASGEQHVEGTWTPHYGGRVTSVGGFDLEFRPKGRLLFTRHRDVPGVLAAITAALAEAEVNVANVALGRRRSDGLAAAVIRVDGSIPVAAREGLRAIAAVLEAHRIKLA